MPNLGLFLRLPSYIKTTKSIKPINNQSQGHVLKENIFYKISIIYLINNNNINSSFILIT